MSSLKVDNSKDAPNAQNATEGGEPPNPNPRRSEPPPSFSEPPPDVETCDVKYAEAVMCGNPAVGEYYSGIQWVRACKSHLDALREAFANNGDVMTERELKDRI
jgi:hypothetical protein